MPGVVEQLLQLGGVVEKAAVAGVGDGQLVTVKWERSDGTVREARRRGGGSSELQPRAGRTADKRSSEGSLLAVEAAAVVVDVCAELSDVVGRGVSVDERGE